MNENPAHEMSLLMDSLVREDPHWLPGVDELRKVFADYGFSMSAQQAAETITFYFGSDALNTR